VNKEIEAKFINIDIEQMRSRLLECGAVCEKPMRLMKRVVYHQANDHDAFIRVRDEGDKITMTYKRFLDSTAIDGVVEVETTVGDFDDAATILDQTGLYREAYQETRRETWQLDGVEIMIDEWPWIEPFVEIEGESEEAVRTVSEKLGFDWSKAVFGGVASVYTKKYKNMGDSAAAALIINRKTPVIRFEDPVPEAFK